VPHTQIGGQCRFDLGHEHHPNAGRERCDIAPSIRRHYSRTLKESKLTSVDATDASLRGGEMLAVEATDALRTSDLRRRGTSARFGSQSILHSSLSRKPASNMKLHRK
jgi:hypothetical protein